MLKRYEVDTEHVNGEGYYNPIAIQDEHNSVGVMAWVFIAVFILMAISVGWMIAEYIG